MKSLLILGIMLFSTGTHAEVFKIAGSLMEFKTKDGLLLKGCEKSCEALKTIHRHKKIDLKAARKGMTYTNSVGSDVCARVYKVDAVLGVAQNRDQRAFCLFKDKSMVEMNSLSSYLLQQKIVSE